LIGVQVTGERVYRFEQSVQSAERDALHIRLFYVLALDVPDDVAKNTNVFERVVLGGAFAQPPPDQQQKGEQRGRTHYQILQTATHNELKAPQAF